MLGGSIGGLGGPTKSLWGLFWGGGQVEKGLREQSEALSRELQAVQSRRDALQAQLQVGNKGVLGEVRGGPERPILGGGGGRW